MNFGTASTSLSLDTPIYRIIDFFELHAILRKQCLRVAKASCFEDENEAIEEILHGLQVVAGPCRGGIGRSWEGNYHDAIRAHTETKHSAFISSWTLKPESVAMWCLYSKEYTGVRIKTTIRKLLNIVKDFQESRSLKKLCRIGSPYTCAVGNCYIEPVHYVDSKKMFNRVVRRKRAYDKLEPILLKKGIQPYQPGQGRSERYTNFLNLPRQPYLIKDHAYFHESEVRAVIRVGRVDHDVKSPDNILSPENIIQGVGDLEAAQFDLPNRAKEDDFDHNVFLDISSDFIEEICVDARCPDFKRVEMLSVIETFGIPVVESDAFGYLPKPEYFKQQYIGS